MCNCMASQVSCQPLGSGDSCSKFHRMISSFTDKKNFVLMTVIYDLKVVVRAEILPRDFLLTLGNYYLSLTAAKIQSLKNFTVKKFVNFYKI